LPPPLQYAPPGPPPGRPRDGVSIAAFVTGLLGLVLVSVVLAIAGLARTAGGQRRGRGFAVAALALSVAWAAAIVVLAPGLLRTAQEPPRSVLPVVASSPSPTSTAPGPALSPSASARPSPTRAPAPEPKPVPARQRYVDDLRTGNCLLTSKLGDRVSKVPVVPCRQAHDAEVVGVTQLTGRWRGEAAMTRQADDTCARLFRRYVGVDVDSSEHGWGWLGPTPASWRQGDRLLVCYVEDEAGTLKGSVKGTST